MRVIFRSEHSVQIDWKRNLCSRTVSVSRKVKYVYKRDI